MNLSMKWLSDYVNIGEVSPREFAEAMTMSGSKVEGYHLEGSDINGVVVGKILSVAEHPDSDHMVICQIDVGAKETLQIVTGANNVKAGDFVPVAVDGAMLPGGKEIKNTKLRGELSQGMLCSLAELGLTANDFPYAIEDGIFILQEENLVLGQDIREAIGLNDTIVEFEITSNRPDCLSVTGLAREAAVTFKKPLNIKAPTVPTGTGNLKDLLSVEVLNPTLCPRYVARAVTNVKIGPSPRWMRERLRASGVRPINNIVDITNYVMLEYCQPMHAFDVNCVEGSKLVIRNAVKGETLLTLDGVEREISPEMLVIADAKKPSAVAGVMGGENSGIHDETVTVVFESANFHGSTVRTTAKKLGMRTESSSRFEKGLDPETCLLAANRAVELVVLLGIGEPLEGVIDINNAPAKNIKIKFEPEWINSFININVSPEDMIKTLEEIGCTMEGDMIIPPSFRCDLEHKADIAEEIARFYGYNNIPTTPLMGSVYGVITYEQKIERLVVNTLLAQGMNEICSYTFVSPKSFDKVRIPADSPLRKTVNITNPLGEDTSVMRTTVYPSMMENLARNYKNRNDSAFLFEIAKEFVPKESPSQLPDENRLITLGIYNQDSDFFTLKGIVEELLYVLGIEDYDVAADSSNPTFHPGRCADITKDGVYIGTMGQAHPLVCDEFEIQTAAYMARLDFEAILKLAKVSDRTYTQLPKFPASTRDIALICDDSLPVLTIEKAIKSAIDANVLESIKLFDHYRGSQIPEGKKSLAFALSLRSAQSTLTEAEIADYMQSAYNAINALGAQLRG